MRQNCLLRLDNKMKLKFLGLLGSLFALPVGANVITFNNTVPWYYTFHGASYTESGLTITAPQTDFYSMSGEIPFNFDGTDFGYLVNGNPFVILSAANPFSLQSFNGVSSNINGEVTINGFQGGLEAIFSETYTIYAGQWNLFNFVGWNNLTSVIIAAPKNSGFGFDNITISGVIAPEIANPVIPEPESLALMGLSLPMMASARRRKSA